MFLEMRVKLSVNLNGCPNRLVSCCLQAALASAETRPQMPAPWPRSNKHARAAICMPGRTAVDHLVANIAAQGTQPASDKLHISGVFKHQAPYIDGTISCSYFQAFQVSLGSALVVSRLWCTYSCRALSESLVLENPLSGFCRCA